MSLPKLIGFSFLALLIVILARLLPNMNLMQSIESVAYGECKVIPGPLGPEDFTIDHKRGLAFISADDRRQYIQSGQFGDAADGAIWTLDLNSEPATPVQMKHDLEGPFHPHGIALYDGDTYELYVVNHVSKYEHEIDVFEIVSSSELKLRRRISYPELIAPNDIIVLGQDRFLASNDHAHPRGTTWEKVEVFLTLPWSSISYFDGNEGHIAVEGLRMANGLALSPDQQTLYVAESTRSTLTRYRQSGSPKRWEKMDEVNIDAAIDNLEWYGPSTLLTGAHPQPLEFLKHTFDASHPSPSEVVAIDVSHETMSSQTWMLDDGNLVSGSSVAARYGDDLYVGVVFEEQLVRCRP